MTTYKGTTINQGLAFGRVYKLVKITEDIDNTVENIDQAAVLDMALAKSTEKLEEQVRTANMLYSDAVSIIFEAHKLMANDPLIVNRAKELIHQNHNAYDSYREAADEVIEEFSRMDSDYIRNRIIDIEDAVDRVLAAIEDLKYEIALNFENPRILVVDKLKPSLTLSLEKTSIIGVISETGSYNQHSGTILRTKDIPTIVIRGCMRLLDDQDTVLLDASEGALYVNPDRQFVDAYFKERG